MNIALNPQDRLIFSFDALPAAFHCRLPAVKAPDDAPCGLVNDSIILDGQPHIETPPHDLMGYDWMQMLVYSENYSNAVVNFFVETENPDSDELCGYFFPINISWTGWKILTFPLTYGFYTFGAPQALDNIRSYRFRQFWGSLPPVQTRLYVQKMWLTNVPAADPALPWQPPEGNFMVEGKKDPDHYAVSLLKKKYPHQAHPRLILTKEKIAFLKEGVRTIPFLQKAYARVLETAEQYLATDPIPYSIEDGRRLKHGTHTAALYPLALCYLIDGKEAFKNRLWQEIETICRYPDWNPQHDIDTGDYSRLIALIYDWMYHEWDENQRRIIRNALMSRACLPFINSLRDVVWSASCDGNHNSVTNSGLGMIGLALGDEDGYEDIANELIHRTAQVIPNNLRVMSPHGVCLEAPAYWRYQQENYYLYEAALYSALGEDLGLHAIPGMEITGDFVMAMNSPIHRAFNYADAPNESPVYSAALLWPAQLYQRMDYAQFYFQRAPFLEEDKARVQAISELLFFCEDMLNAPCTERKKDYFLGTVGSLSSNCTDPNAWYIGFKGGKKMSHMDLDAGSFVLDVLGKRWVSDLGQENYDMPGMWAYEENAGRWLHYRKRAEGNNTLVINPRNRPCIADHNPEAVTEITECFSCPGEAMARLDLSAACGQKAIRTFRLTENRSKFILEDALDCSIPSEIFSYLHTQAEVTIAPDGKSAALTQDGVTLHVHLDAPDGIMLKVMPAEPLLEKFQRIPHRDNTGYRKLAVHGEGVTQAAIRLEFSC
ncbi:MAG: hypothetical protein E7324_09940 [Clostridiales bacterium]|nr:hypothetical protein [Clostridiales bacterium]